MTLFHVNCKLLSLCILYSFERRLKHLVATVTQHYLVNVEIMQWYHRDLDIICEYVLCILSYLVDRKDVHIVRFKHTNIQGCTHA